MRVNGYENEINLFPNLRQFTLNPITELPSSNELKKVYKVYKNSQNLKSHIIKRKFHALEIYPKKITAEAIFAICPE